MTETPPTYRDPLPIIVGDRQLPDGYDAWAIRSVHPDLRSRNNYRYPWPGGIATAAGPFITTNHGGCPEADGDGICASLTYAGMASGGIPARTLLLVAYREADVLGREGGGKLRLREFLVVDVIDGERLSRAYLGGANLTGADLYGADLGGADLTGANLTRANLYGAYLTGANLHGANLTQSQVDGARCDTSTQLPSELTNPSRPSS